MKQIDEFYLDNGLKVIMKDVPSSPVSSVYVWVKTGSAYENDSERGLAHVHEHMIFKGTSQLPVGEISKQIEFYGEILMHSHQMMKLYIMQRFLIILLIRLLIFYLNVCMMHFLMKRS